MSRGFKQDQATLERAFWAVVREERERRGISIRELAEEVGVSAGQMSDVLNGKKPATATEAANAAAAVGLRLSVAWATAEDLAEKHPEDFELAAYDVPDRKGE